MRFREIPVLPFAIDLRSAMEWLDRLPVSNIRECCRLLFPMMQALSLHPMEPRLRFAILERFRPVLFGAARGLQSYIVDPGFPLDGKAKKIASLAARLHLETSLNYRQVVEAPEFADVFAEDERVLILSRALEHLAHAQLRAAQVYEALSSFDADLKKLYLRANASGLLDAATECKSPTSIRQMLAAIMLFKRAAPGRLTRADMQRLFDRLWPRMEPKETRLNPDGRGRRAVFWYDHADPHLWVPGLSTAPPGPGLAFIAGEKRPVDPLSEDRTHELSKASPLDRATSRLGGLLPCRENAGRRSAMLSVGFASIASMLQGIADRRSSAWSKIDSLELAPLGSHLASQARHQAKFVGRASLADLVAAAESAEDMRAVNVVATELPGFYLIDSGRWTFRAGLLAALNSGDQYIQVGIVRSGQLRDGRFWHSFELLGAQARPVSVGDVKEDLRSGLLVPDDEAQEPTLIVPPAKWHRIETVSLPSSEGWRVFRLVKLLEAGVDFQHFALAEIDSAETA